MTLNARAAQLARISRTLHLLTELARLITATQRQVVAGMDDTAGHAPQHTLLAMLDGMDPNAVASFLIDLKHCQTMLDGMLLSVSQYVLDRVTAADGELRYLPRWTLPL